jgi:hypothetical protein
MDLLQEWTDNAVHVKIDLDRHWQSIVTSLLVDFLETITATTDVALHQVRRTLIDMFLVKTVETRQ